MKILHTADWHIGQLFHEYDRTYGDVLANGENSIAVSVSNDRQTPLNNISAISKQGIAVQISKGKVGDRSGLTANGAKGNIFEG